MSDGISTLSLIPPQFTTPQPEAAIAEPIIPPISAWLELEGSPMSHVMRFQVIAPTRPAMTISSVIASWSMMPFAIVAATATETNAPAKLRTAALATATRGLSARVDTLVAIELAVSWKPFVKSKNSAIATTATRVRFIYARPVPVSDFSPTPAGERPAVGVRLKSDTGFPHCSAGMLPQAFLTTMFAITFAAVSQLSSARSSRS